MKKVSIKRIQKSWYVYLSNRMLAQEFGSVNEALNWSKKVFPKQSIEVK